MCWPESYSLILLMVYLTMANTVLINRSCLESSQITQPTQSSHSIVQNKLKPHAQQKTCVQALNNFCDIMLSQLLQPCGKGDGIATPLRVDALCTKLSILWNLLRKWGIIFLVKNFYGLYFSSLEDARSVREITTLNLNLVT